MGTILFFAGAVQDRGVGLCVITSQHLFCTATRLKFSLCVIEDPVAAFAARERVPLLDKSIMGAFFDFDRSFVGWSHLADTVIEVLTLQTQYYMFYSSHPTSNVDLFKKETTV